MPSSSSSWCSCEYAEAESFTPSSTSPSTTSTCESAESTTPSSTPPRPPQHLLAEDVKWLIHQHLLSLMESFPSLRLKTATFTHNEGSKVDLLQAYGTIPMTFRHITYYIPVLIWLTEAYPRQPPRVYVNPTSDMIMKHPHPHVNSSGLVSIAYLQDWKYPTSNLLDLASNLSAAFGQDPPLYSMRPTPNLGPNSISSVVRRAIASFCRKPFKKVSCTCLGQS